MGKIKCGPVVEMQGDEMTRCIVAVSLFSNISL